MATSASPKRAMWQATAAPLRLPPSREPSVRCAGRGTRSLVRATRPGRGHAHDELLGLRVEVAPVGDESDRHSLVEEERQDGPRRARPRRLHRVPQVGGEAGARVDRRFRRQVVRPRVPERGHDAAGGQPLDGGERQRQLGRDGDQANEVARGYPFVDGPQVDRRQLLDGDRAGGLRVQKRPFEVEAEAERIGRLLHGPRGKQVARDARRSQPCGVVDVQVDEPRKDERFRGASVPPLDPGDDSVLQDERAGEGALDRVNENSL